MLRFCRYVNSGKNRILQVSILTQLINTHLRQMGMSLFLPKLKYWIKGDLIPFWLCRESHRWYLWIEIYFGKSNYKESKMPSNFCIKELHHQHKHGCHLGTEKVCFFKLVNITINQAILISKAMWKDITGFTKLLLLVLVSDDIIVIAIWWMCSISNCVFFM